MSIIKIEEIEELMYQSFKKAIIDFSKTENNKDVYAVVFDCDLSNFSVCIRYANENDYEKRLINYDKYAYMYKPYGKKGLLGYKYNSVGDFNRIEWEADSAIKHFFNSCRCQSTDAVYYENADRPADTFEYKGAILRGDVQTELLHCCNGEFQKDGEFYIGLASELSDVFEELIINCILRLKDDYLGLDKTDNFIVFMSDHDISNATFSEYVSRTVDKNIFDQLTDYSNFEQE